MQNMIHYSEEDIHKLVAADAAKRLGLESWTQITLRIQTQIVDVQTAIQTIDARETVPEDRR